MTREQIENIFTHHPPFGTQPERYQRIRQAAEDLAFLLQDACPESREKSLAVTNLQQSVMWANASIALNERPVEPARIDLGAATSTIPAAASPIDLTAPV